MDEGMKNKEERTRVAIDLGKRQSYFVVEKNGIAVREGYTPTNRRGFNDFLCDVEEGSRVIIEACGATDRVSRFLEGYDVVVVHPYKVRVIAESLKKTDRHDTHFLLDLDRLGQLPLAWMPDEKTRRNRDLCRNRYFLVKQRTAVKIRIKDYAYRLGMDFESFSERRLKILKALNNPILSVLISRLDELNKNVKEMDGLIHSAYLDDPNAKLIDTIPGFAEYASLAVSSELGDASRFSDVHKLFAYAGMVPGVRQSGDYERHGRMIRGNSFLKYILIECTTTHLRCCDSRLTKGYYRMLPRTGRINAKIGTARRILGVMYYMIKRGERFDPDYGRETSSYDLSLKDAHTFDAPIPNRMENLSAA